jgi:hypothetical protein
MKSVHIFFICFFLITATIVAQDKAEVPPDVPYEPATDAVNDLAKAELQKALTGDKAATKQMLSESLTCGPMLWQDIKPMADKSLVEARKVIAVIGVPQSRAVEGRAFDTESERQDFWRTLLKKYPQLATPTKIRKATAWEISYFWATVPFEKLREPFFAIEAGPNVFVANLRVSDGKPALYWIDRVGTFEDLQTSPTAR